MPSSRTTDTPPPGYTNAVDPRKDRLPPYKASHTFANSQEELAALREFAESKLRVDPGTNGMLPDIRGGGLKSLACGGAAREIGDGDLGWGLTAETREERKRREKEERERRGSVVQRLKRLISGGGKAE